MHLLPKNILLLTALVLSLQMVGQVKDSIVIEAEKEELKRDTNLVHSFLQASDSLLTINTIKSKEYAQKAKKEAQQLSFEKGVGLAHMSLGNIAKQNNNYPKALNHYILARDIFSQTGEKIFRGKSLNKIGVVYQKSANYDLALKNFDKAAEIFEKVDRSSFAGVLNNMGLAYFSQSKYGDAIIYLRKSLEIREELGDKEGMAGNYNNIGNIYYLQGNYKDAFDYYKTSLDIKREIGDSANLANSYTNVGLVYKFRNEFDSAEAYLSEALFIHKAMNNNRGIITTTINTGDLLFEQGEISKALIHYQNGYQKAIKKDFQSSKLHALIGIGRCHVENKNYQKAINHFNRSLNIAREISDKERIKDIYSDLSGTYEKAGNYKAALTNYKKFKTLNDSLSALKNQKQLAEAEAKYNVEQKQQEIDFLKRENAINQLKLEKNQVITYAFGFSLFLVILILIIIYRNSQQKQKNNKLLKSKNENIRKQKEEKDVLIKEIHHRVKNNLQVIISLLRLQSSFSDDKRVKKLFEESENRVLSMSLIHEKLYQSKDLSKIKIAEYINELIQNLIDTYRLELDIKLETEIDEISFDVSTLIPVGLLLNEIISNSLKYAFEGRDKGTIKVSLKKLPDENKHELLISDNGVGIPSELYKKSNSLGLELIDTFVEQLSGEKEILDKPGTHYRITF